MFLTRLSGEILPPVRGDDLQRDRDFAVAVADPVTGARGAAAQAQGRGSRRRVKRALYSAGDWFNRNFDRYSAWYGRVTRKLMSNPRKVLLTYGGLVAATLAPCSG